MSRFKNAAAFRQALEDRLKRLPGPIEQKRHVLAMQRLLFRIGLIRPDVVLKGGMALKIRHPAARATKDLDLRLDGNSVSTLADLQGAAALSSHDFMTYLVRFSKPLGQVEGHRFRAECQIAGKPFSAFDIDVVTAEPAVGEVDSVLGADWLDFIDVATPAFRLYPLASQIAEKLHALTRPRNEQNTRVKDLPDLALLASLCEGVRASTIRDALEQTFTLRRTHPLPQRLPSLPASWTVPYAHLATTNTLPWQSLDEAFSAVSRFLDPLLGHSTAVQAKAWSVRPWAWR